MPDLDHQRPPTTTPERRAGRSPAEGNTPVTPPPPHLARANSDRSPYPKQESPRPSLSRYATSFVYPVRSLLNQAIQEDGATPPPVGTRTPSSRVTVGRTLFPDYFGQSAISDVASQCSPTLTYGSSQLAMIQSYGALVALDENALTNELVVRQASENCPSIIGHTPDELFALPSFTDCLSSQSAAVLQSAIDALPTPIEDGGVYPPCEEVVRVVLLTGHASQSAGGQDAPWFCWTALHRTPSTSRKPSAVVLELEPQAERPYHRPPPTQSADALDPSGDSNTLRPDLSHSDSDSNAALHQAESATVLAALSRFRQVTTTNSRSPSPTARRGKRTKHLSPASLLVSGVDPLGAFGMLAQIGNRLDGAVDVADALRIAVGIVQSVTGFDRVMALRFGEDWAGEILAEVKADNVTDEDYMGLSFRGVDVLPDWPETCPLNRVRTVYEGEHPLAHVIPHNPASSEDVDMRYCRLNPANLDHTKRLRTMGVRSTFTMSIKGSAKLWGVIVCHSYGDEARRVPLSIQEALRLISQSISRSIEKLIYEHQLKARKMLDGSASGRSNAHAGNRDEDDFLSLFNANYGVVVIGANIKILGPSFHGQDLLLMAKYLQIKRFPTLRVSNAIHSDFPDLVLPSRSLAGVLYIPLVYGGQDFLALVRRECVKRVRWAEWSPRSNEQPRQPQLMVRTQVTEGEAMPWTEEQLQVASALALVSKRFIGVSHPDKVSKREAVASHVAAMSASRQVKRPLTNIIQAVNSALGENLDEETRDSLEKSRVASKNLLCTINNILDVASMESGNKVLSSDRFHLPHAIDDAARPYISAAVRQGLRFNFDITKCPPFVVGDSKKIQSLITNLTANALQHTMCGTITVRCERQVDALEIMVGDTGSGITPAKLGSIFGQLERVDLTPREGPPQESQGTGLGLAQVARVVEQLGGTLRVDSSVGRGSCFTCLIPLSSAGDGRSTPYLGSLGSDETKTSYFGQGSSHDVHAPGSSLAKTVVDEDPDTDTSFSSDSTLTSDAPLVQPQFALAAAFDPVPRPRPTVPVSHANMPRPHSSPRPSIVV